MAPKYSKVLDSGIESAEFIPNIVEGTANVCINTPEIPPKKDLSGLFQYTDAGVRDYLSRRESWKGEPMSARFDRMSLFGSYVEGNSVLSDCFMGLARVVTFSDMDWLRSPFPCDVEAMVAHFRPLLQTVVTTHLLKGEDPTKENIARAYRQVCLETKIYIDLMHKAKLVESIDAIATIENYNTSQLPRLIDSIIDRSTNDIDFAKTVIRCFSDYFRKLFAVIIYCCLDGKQGLDTVVRNFLRLSTSDIYKQLFVEYMVLCCMFNLRSYIAKLNVPLEDIEVFIVRRMVGKETSETSQEPMEVIAPTNEDARVSLESQLFSENECLSTDRDTEYRLPAKRRK